MIPVFKPALAAQPTRLLETLDSSWWGTGPRVAEFEEAFADYIGVDPVRCLMLNSCTAALHIAMSLRVCGASHQRVLVPAITFISTGLAPLYEGCEVVIVDVGDDLCIDQADALNKLKSSADVVIAVHMGGQVADLSKLRGCRLIEDCAHALGSFEGEIVRRDSKTAEKAWTAEHVGTFAAGCFSFQATKVLPIGDGGMLVLADADDRQRAAALSWCGIAQSTWDRTGEGYRWQYEVSEIGYKYRANDVMAALALDQWRGLAGILWAKAMIADLYSANLNDLAWLELPAARPGTRPNWQEYIVRCDERDRLHDHLQEKGIASTVHYWPIHHYAPFVERIEGGFASYSVPNAERLAARILTIPSYATMTQEEVERVIDGIRTFRP
jgi:perosamine synthetase